MPDIIRNVEHSTNQHALPPPGADELTDGDRVVGWIVDDRVGFGGFATAQEAAHAAWVAYRTMERRRAWESGARPLPIDIEPLTIHRRDDAEVIAASGRDVATLVRPDAGPRSAKASFGFEISLPHATDALALRASAYHMYRALRRSGVRWEMWRKRVERVRRPVARQAAVTPAPEVSSRSRIGTAATVLFAAVVATVALLQIPNGSATTVLLALVLIALGFVASTTQPPRWRVRPLPGYEAGEPSHRATVPS
jgi:hypothetical protein